MKKTVILLAVLVLATLAGIAGAAQYAVPCFEWDCAPGQGNCDFDASCSGAGGVWAYSWNFGDGTSANWLGVPTVSHYYAGGANKNVTLTLAFFGKPDESTTCNVVYRNVIGPPVSLTGDCP